MKSLTKATTNLPVTMSLYEICKLTETRHNDTISRIMPEYLNNQEFGLATQIAQPINTGKGRVQEIQTYALNKTQTLILSARLSPALLIKVIHRLEELEEAVALLQARDTSVELQKKAMHILQLGLEPLQKSEKLNYIRVNVVCNKAVSNLYGLPKMIKKASMTSEMLLSRDKILEDYINLFNVLETSEGIKEILYKKYTPSYLTLA